MTTTTLPKTRPTPAGAAPPPPAAARGPIGADRFIAFAFAAADLLVETDLAGRITFATGAFRSRFGATAESYVGMKVTELFIPQDGTALGMALTTVSQRGRIAPLALDLADRNATKSSVAALLMPADSQSPARLCFSIGPIATRPEQPPCAALASSLGGTAPVRSPAEFARDAENTLRGGLHGSLSLLEIKGLEQRGERRSELESRLAQTLTEAGPGIIAGRLADGKFGLMSAPNVDASATVERLSAVLRSLPGCQTAQITSAAIELAQGDLTAGQAARALRYALGRFIDGGVEATGAIGGAQGLAGIVAKANARAVGIRNAIAERRFRLAYQPVVSLDDRRTHHYEALLRPIQTPGSPAQNTQEFVTFAEAVGLSEELDWAVLQAAIEILIARRTVSIAVNISGLSMQNPAFRDRLVAQIEDLRSLPERPGARLLVELTETAEIADMLGAATSIDALRAAGVPVCLDDFGAGSAALRYLRSFQVDFVKIDGVYVQGAAQNPRDRGFVTSIIEMAATAQAEVVAEMIETEEQAFMMRDMGVRFGQGWLFGKPGVLPGIR
jgi:EAL domain-containing protein (putative c-di-GMP-specific phosphodiesterase class I)